MARGDPKCLIQFGINDDMPMLLQPQTGTSAALIVTVLRDYIKDLIYPLTVSASPSPHIKLFHALDSGLTTLRLLPVITCTRPARNTGESY